MFELISYPFFQRAFVAGILVGFLASYYGVFIVQRGLSFLGSGLAHAAFGGVALGLLLSVEPLWIAVPFYRDCSVRNYLGPGTDFIRTGYSGRDFLFRIDGAGDCVFIPEEGLRRRCLQLSVRFHPVGPGIGFMGNPGRGCCHFSNAASMGKMGRMLPLTGN